MGGLLTQRKPVYVTVRVICFTGGGTKMIDLEYSFFYEKKYIYKIITLFTK